MRDWRAAERGARRRRSVGLPRRGPKRLKSGVIYTEAICSAHSRDRPIPLTPGRLILSYGRSGLLRPVIVRLRARVASRVRRLWALPAALAHRAVTIAWVARRLEKRYERAVELHRPKLPALTGLDSNIADGLARSGVFVTSLDALGLAGSPALLRTAQQSAVGYGQTAASRALAGDQFIMLPRDSVQDFDHLFRWGVHQRLLDIVETYVGLPPAYDGAGIHYTVADGRLRSTRAWHRDREDRKMVKIVVYLHDVSEDSGPFQIDSSGPSSSMVVDPTLPTTCCGPAGTVIFTDTARYLHRGKPARQDRAAIFYGYFSYRPRNPFFCERFGLSRRSISKLATGLPTKQAAAILWHESLPALVRWLPAAPI